MAEQIIAELESSAQVLLAPPNIITPEQRHCAENVFLNFQKTKSPVTLCQFILANSRCDYVKFQAASLLKLTIIRDWSLLDKAEVETVRSGLLNFVISNPTLQNYVREQLLLVVAIMVKRSSVDERGEGVVGKVLTDVSQLISSGESTMQTIGCSVLTALLNEFSSTTRASDVGLTWETHLKAKKSFEKTDLKRLFQYCLQGLSELNKIGVPLPSEATRLFKKFLIIAEQVLTWNFQFAMLLPRKLIGIFESQQSPALRPSMEWHEVFMDPNVLQLFFKLHWQVREEPDLCHHTLQCLNQLASLNGTVMAKKEDRCNYFAWFIENLLKLLRSGPVKNYEALGISNTISRLQVFFPAEFMATLPPELLRAYLAELTSLTCRFCESAAEEELLQKDDQVFMEAFDYILDAWVTILQENQSYPLQVIKQSSIEIFNQYLKSHLSPPDGTRGIAPHFKDDVDEAEEDDRAKYRDQLGAIGAFGRQVMDHSIPVLFRLIEDRVTRLHGQLQRIHQQSLNSDDSTVLESLNEDIHWIVLIIGHVLSCVSEGETSLIPQEVIQYCIKEVSNISIETTLQVLASPTHKVADIPGAEHNTDPVVRLISAVFRLCEVEKRALEANLSHLLSPELALTIIWFMSRWSVTYLLPNETYYTEVSMTLAQAFGRDSEAGLWTLNFLIGKLESNFVHWASESKLVTENAQALVSILNNTERGDKAMNCSALISLVQKQTTGVFQSLPTPAKRSLLKSLVIVGTANKQASTKEQYWNGLLKPLQDRFQMVTQQQNFASIYYHKHVMNEVSDLIECLTGVVDGCSMINLSHLLPFINPLFEEIVKFVDIYHNYSNIVGMVFQVFSTAAKRILCFLNQADSRKLYECCLTMIRIYAKHNSGKLTKEASAEEEQYQDILVLMQLLTDLLSKDFIDFAPSSGTENSAESMPAADVALYGLNIIMPMMNIELLKFPSLCVQYFKLIAFVCEIYPNKIHTLPTDLFKTLMSSVELGLNSFTAEVSVLCLDFLSVLGVYLHRGGYQTSFAYEVLKPFLKLVLYMLLFEPLDADLTQVASSTLFTLICCFQEKYQELVHNLISSQADSTTAQRLATSFTTLTTNINLSLDRYSRIQFRDNFEVFITEVRGYLCVK